MNIFFLDKCPRLAAHYHCDRHVIKMILESAQLLSTAHRVLYGKEGFSLSVSGRKTRIWTLPSPVMDSKLYKATHINHPCAIWIRESSENYFWLYQLMIELNKEFVRRYNKKRNHATIDLLGSLLSIPPANFPKDGFIIPPQCMPKEYQCDDYVQAYRNYYIGAKQAIVNWTNTPIPPWYKFQGFSMKQFFNFS